MIITGITTTDFEDIVRNVSSGYSDNVIVNNLEQLSKNRITATIRVKDSKGPGAHRGPSGRRTIGCCWHVHYDIMDDIFGLNEDARIQTAMATYRGVNDFTNKADEVGEINVGSRVNPISFIDTCDCDSES